MDITTFTTWFIQQFVRIGQTLLAHLDSIKLYNTVSLMDFIITITIIGGLIAIIITIPQNMSRISKTAERKIKRDK